MPTRNGMMRLSTALAAGAALSAAPGAAELALGENAVSYTGHTHFVAVGFSALVASAAAVGAVALAWPSLLPAVPAPGSRGALILLVVGLAAFALVTFRALRTFLLTRRLLDLAVVVGLFWLATAVVPALLMDYTQLGWW